MTIEGLFAITDIWDGNPLTPDPHTPTPADVVATLTPAQRKQRVTALIAQSQQIVNDALATHSGTCTITARCTLYSGDTSSTVLTHLMRPHTTHAVHLDTTIGLDHTRQFVHDTCAQWGIPLVQEQAPVTYRDLVLIYGLPGPTMHWLMSRSLKERPVRQARRRFVIDGRRERVLFMTGRRRATASRPSDVLLHEREDSIIWASPLALWTDLDLETYHQMQAPQDAVPVNPAIERIGSAGDCLCGSLAQPEDLEEIGFWYPDMAKTIADIERAVTAAGHPEPLNQWGHGTSIRGRSVQPGSASATEQPALWPPHDDSESEHTALI